MKNNRLAILVRVILAASIVWSIGMMYYVNIVQKNYLVFTNPDGKPDLSK